MNDHQNHLVKIHRLGWFLVVVSLFGGLQNALALSLDALFSADRVIEVQITMSENDWNALRYQNREIDFGNFGTRRYGPMPSPFTYFDAQVRIDGVDFLNVGVRKKGFLGSLSNTRPSLKIKLDHKLRGGHLDGLSTLTLNNNKQDRSLVSQYLSYSLFRRAGLPASRCGFAQVFVNGKNLGVYSHVETVRKPLLRREFETDAGTLFEGTVVDFDPGWENAFELKTGDDAQGRRRIAGLIKALQSQGHFLLSPKSSVKAFVPEDARFHLDWMKIDFDDSKWVSGRNALGYEMDRGYEDHIDPALNFHDRLYNQTPSAYLRYVFEMDALEDRPLILQMRFDDGFIAYLNGARIASANAPRNPRWNSRATDSHEDSGWKAFPISNPMRLIEGKNVLAIQALNQSVGSSDMLCAAALQLETTPRTDGIGEYVELESFYKYWAMEGLLGFWDGYSGNRNNYFIYVLPSGKMHFMPWGADSLFTNNSKVRSTAGRPKSVKTHGALARYLWAGKAQRDRYGQTIRWILEEHWDEDALLSEIHRLEVLLKPFVCEEQRHFAWSMDEVKRFIRNRRLEVMLEVERDFQID